MLHRLMMVGAVGGLVLAAAVWNPGSGLAQESVAVRAALIEGAVPADDPAAAAWAQAPVGTFPLSPQVHWPDRIGEVTATAVTVRALHDGTRLAVRLDYADPTQDPDDAAALEFMVGDKKAHFAHGQPMDQVEGGPVNIWNWKHKSAKALDMNAKGFGTLTVQAQQDVTAKGVYRDGTWSVVFSRALATGDAAQDAQITPGKFLSVAFAIWDGRRLESGELKEKGSQKAVSSWWYFRAEPPPDRSPILFFLLAAGAAVGLELVIIRKLRKGSAS